MAGPEFFQTVMGRSFFEGTMPALVRELKKLNENLQNDREVRVYGSRVPEADRVAFGLRPTGWDPTKFKEKLTELIAKGENSGEAAGRMLGEHLEDMHDEKPEVIVAELENVIEWARVLLRDLK